MMNNVTRWTVVMLVAIVVVTSCGGRKEIVYSWRADTERRELVLTKDNRFILSIDAGYFSRVDTGRYQFNGDTLVLNPGKQGNMIESIVEMDTLFEGKRFMEIWREELLFDQENKLVDAYYQPVIFPAAVVNGELSLELIAEDQAFRKLFIPQDVDVRQVKVILPEEMTCRPFLNYTLSIRHRDEVSQSYRIYIRSAKSKDRYLAGFKWLVKGDTIATRFHDEACSASDIKLVREK